MLPLIIGRKQRPRRKLQQPGGHRVHEEAHGYGTSVYFEYIQRSFIDYESSEGEGVTLIELHGEG